MMKQLLLPLALVATLASGCTLGGIMTAAGDVNNPSRNNHPVLDVVAGMALDAIMVGTIYAATKDLGPFYRGCGDTGCSD